MKNKKIDKKLILKIGDDLESFLNKKIASLGIKGFTAPIILKHVDTYKELIYLYKYDERPLSIGYSGGKDSTVTMDIIFKALMLFKYIYNAGEQLKKRTYVMFSDTLLEMDPVIEGILKSIKQIEIFSTLHQLNVDVRRVSPIVKNTLFSLMIGKGYTVPRTDNRYCTDRMKILPQKKAILSILNENKSGFIAITGQRQDESSDRKKRMEKVTIEGSYKEHDYKGCNLYAPVEYWSSNDIWTHIYSHGFDWIDSTTLGRVYAEAANDGDECRSLFEGFEANTPGCGRSARYGCWVCTLFEKDKTLNNLSMHYDYLKHMEEFRNWLVQYRQAPWDNNRDVFIHGKHKMKLYDFDNHRRGMRLPGGFNIRFRMEILSRLLDAERKVVSERGAPLISDEELAYIQECWCEDGDLEMSVKKIAYDRNYEHLINPMYLKVIESVEQMKNFDNLPKYYARNFSWSWIYNSNGRIALDSTKFCERYFAQMAIQLEKRGHDSYNIMNALKSRTPSPLKDGLIEYIKSLPLERMMDFVDASKENYIRKEWQSDKIGFLTFLEMYDKKEIKTPTKKNLFGYESDYAEHFEALDEFSAKGGDIINCESISLDDKMRFFDG